MTSASPPSLGRVTRGGRADQWRRATRQCSGAGSALCELVRRCAKARPNCETAWDASMDGLLQKAAIDRAVSRAGPSTARPSHHVSHDQARVDETAERQLEGASVGGWSGLRGEGGWLGAEGTLQVAGKRGAAEGGIGSGSEATRAARAAHCHRTDSKCCECRTSERARPAGAAVNPSSTPMARAHRYGRRVEVAQVCVHRLSS